MKAKENTIDRVVQEGQIDYYVPFCFWAEDECDIICKKIYDGFTNNIRDHSEYVKQAVHQTLEETGLFAIKTPRNYSLLNKFLPPRKDQKTDKTQDATASISGTNVTLSPTDNGLQIGVIPGQAIAYNERLQKLINEEARIKEVYGDTYFNNHTRIVLPPFHVTLFNNKSDWLNAVLYVFKNKMAILKLELPIKNVSFSLLQHSDTEHLIKEISSPWGVEFTYEASIIDSVWKAYLDKINEFGNFTKYRVNHYLRNTILTLFDDQPKHIQTASDELLFDLYQIVSAPVQVIEEKRPYLIKKGKDYLDYHYYGDGGIRYYFNTAGDCLTIIDDTAREYLYKQLLAEDEDIDDRALNYYLVSSGYLNVEFSLIIFMLKTLNGSSAFNEKALDQGNYTSLQKQYNTNRIFIAHLQEGCYGSVSEQVNLIEKCMRFYRKKDIEMEKATALDQIILEQKSQQNEIYQKRTTALGIVITLIVGLPSIVESLSILRSWIPFLPEDIPILTTEIVGGALWLALGLILLFWVKKKR